jgi:nitroreductase
VDNAIELIEKRVSVRTYSSRTVEKDKLVALDNYLKDNAGNPFGAVVRFAVLESEYTPHLGTYGFIRGAKAFLSGCVKKGGRDIEGFGFEFERAVLYATSLGLGTCWIGGLFTRDAFAAALKPEDEHLPAISPVGYAAERKSLIERAVAAGAGARKRKDASELFFEGDWSKPLEASRTLMACLEMVRLAPSASNKQPWRAIRTDSGLHFYMKADKKYAGNTMFGYCMQRIDMGIAACHFYLSAKETGLEGEIVFDDPCLLSGEQIKDGLSYSFSWR